MTVKSPKAVPLDMRVVKEAFDAACEVLKANGERPVALLIVAALIVDNHARIVGDPISETADIVKTFATQLRAGVQLNASTNYRKPS